jgi:hypothetical protein
MTSAQFACSRPLSSLHGVYLEGSYGESGYQYVDLHNKDLMD